ncbi:hypothetical protein ABK040_001107 [Willaertia magna]
MSRKLTMLKKIAFSSFKISPTFRLNAKQAGTFGVFSNYLLNQNNKFFSTNIKLYEGNISNAMNEIHQSYNKSDFAETQRKYDHLYNNLFRAHFDEIISMKDNLNSIIETTFNHIETIQKHFAKEPSEITFPLYKAKWGAGNVYQALGEYEEAEKLISQALKLLPKGNKDDGPRLKINLASILNYLGKHEEAFKLHKQAIEEIGPKVNWKNGMETASAFHEMGEYYLATDNNSTLRAIQCFEKALSICESFYGWTTPQTTKTALILSRLYLETNRIDFSIILGEKALVGVELFLETYDAEVITVSGAYLARAYEKKGFLPFQQSTITRVYNILRRKKSETDSNVYLRCVFKLENMLGACRYMQGSLQIAEQTFEKLDQLSGTISAEWIEAEPEEARFEIAHMRYFNGACKIGLGKYQQGIEELQKSKQMFQTLLRSDWVGRIDELLNEAKVRLATENNQA